jgi:hypothetical protein
VQIKQYQSIAHYFEEEKTGLKMNYLPKFCHFLGEPPFVQLYTSSTRDGDP